jgi:plastocyanin
MHKSLLLLVAAGLFAAACGTQTPSASAATDASAVSRVSAKQGKPVDPATAGSVSGKVTLSGPAPAPEMLHVAVDQTCIQAMGTTAKSDAVLIGADGAIQNAFVYIKDSMSDYTFDVPSTPVVLDQKGCRYSPRIFGVRVGQPLEMVNSDATLHNVHAMPMVNQEFNRGMPQQNSRMTQIFTAPEQMVRFKCDLHAWMNAYGGVMPHPFFAVTGEDGAFTLKGVPPGKYDVAVWHEKLGTATQTVEIGNSQAVALNFTLTAAKK